MMVTVHLSDGRKITKDQTKLAFFTARQFTKEGEIPLAQEGVIHINLDHVVDMRPADEIEKQHARIHGW